MRVGTRRLGLIPLSEPSSVLGFCVGSALLHSRTWSGGAADLISLAFGRAWNGGGCPKQPKSSGYDGCRHASCMFMGLARLGSPVAAGGAKERTKEIPAHLLPLRRRLKAIKRLDPKIQRDVLTQGLGRPRCQRAQRLLKRGDPQSISVRCPLFLHQLKPRLRLWKKALTADDFPPQLYPEVAFAGRSNAGKSTLLNELCGRSGTAFVSKRPGSTQDIYFFKAGSPCCLCLVDLPGYGYAEAEASKRLHWTEMALFYLKSRQNLRRVFLLIDARWGLKASDLCMLYFFERHGVPFQLVLTKADLPEQKSLIKILQGVSEDVKKLKGCAGPPIAVSALRHRGLDPLRAEIGKLRLSKEVVVGRLKMQAANLMEVRRLKKEARAKAKAERANSASGTSPTIAPPAADASGGPNASDDIVARALGRWGVALESGIAKGSAWGVLGNSSHVSARNAVEQAAHGGNISQFWKAERAVGSECRVDGGTSGALDEHVLARKDCGTETRRSAATELDIVLDRVLEVLPLPDVSTAEALISNVLRVSPHGTQQIGRGIGNANAGVEETAAGHDVSIKHDAHLSAFAAPPVSLPKTHSPDVATHAWDGRVFQEFSLVPSASKSALASMTAPSAFLHSDDTVSESGVSRWALNDAAGCSTADSKPSRTDIDQEALAIEGPNAPYAEPGKLSGSRGYPAPPRSLEALRAKDWRARRVSCAAVEIDLSLSREGAAGGGASVHLSDEAPTGQLMNSLHADPPGRQALPDLSAVLSAHKNQNTNTAQSRPARRPSAPSPGKGVLIDEETLAAAELGTSGTRAKFRNESPPDPSNYTGALELAMEHSFGQKWRRELLPIDDLSEPFGTIRGKHNDLQQRDNTGFARRCQTGIANPFRIPPDYITIKKDRRKPVMRRQAFNARLQRAQEAYHPSNDPAASGYRDHSSADALLFSAAQRRQKRRFREVMTKASRRQARSKEMTWDVAYTKWVRWAKAHPNLARQATPPKKAQLFANFRNKTERAAGAGEAGEVRLEASVASIAN